MKAGTRGVRATSPAVARTAALARVVAVGAGRSAAFARVAAAVRRSVAFARVAVGVVVVAAGLLCAMTGVARADSTPAQVFADGVKALHDGRAGDAITSFEALADLGVVDAAASYDRGLAYAARVRIGAEVPGDLGRAAHGFEEARDLTRDPSLADDAGRALAVVRSEVARRRTEAGQKVEVDPGRSLGRTVSTLLPEDAWAWLAIACCAAISAGLFVRWLGAARRLRIAGGVAAGVAAPGLVLATAMTLLARHDRLWLREAVVVSASARPSDDAGMVAQGTSPLPEGARVEITDDRGARTRFRFGRIDGWVPSDALRELAR